MLKTSVPAFQMPPPSPPGVLSATAAIVFELTFELFRLRVAPEPLKIPPPVAAELAVTVEPVRVVLPPFARPPPDAVPAFPR